MPFLSQSTASFLRQPSTNVLTCRGVAGVCGVTCDRVIVVIVRGGNSTIHTVALKFGVVATYGLTLN